MVKQENMYAIGSSNLHNEHIHYYLQLVTEQGEWMKNKTFHKEQYAALNKHVLLLHIESINSSCITYGLIGSTFKDGEENSWVKV